MRRVMLRILLVFLMALVAFLMGLLAGLRATDLGNSTFNVVAFNLCIVLELVGWILLGIDQRDHRDS